MAKKKQPEYPQCGACAYFFAEDGKCRRHPPVIVGIDADYQPIQAFPVREAESIACGEFRQRLNS
ncbi:MAG: hypothetical protein AAFO57_00170 [Pseudomonadota bacterium]